MPGPVLFCYDGSEGSRSALREAGDLIARPADGYVVTVWQPAYVRLAMAGTFGPAVLSDEADADEKEAAYAQNVAEEGAKRGREHGYDLAPIAERAEDGVAQAILGVADRLDVKLIVCGQKGRGPIRTTLLGSVSHALSAHTKRPILIAPEPK
ncbi:MAG TPA: universal stress protein [Acidimicrobiales bacterium]|nr:universal stress protein [Acidimicrobiales bacterium]